MFINGSLNSTTSGNYSIPHNVNSVNSYMGYWNKNNTTQQGNTFNGYVSDFRIYRRNLSNDEVNTLYTYPRTAYTYITPSSATILTSSIAMNSWSVTINFSGHFTTIGMTKNGNVVVGSINSNVNQNHNYHNR